MAMKRPFVKIMMIMAIVMMSVMVLVMVVVLVIVMKVEMVIVMLVMINRKEAKGGRGRRGLL